MYNLKTHLKQLTQQHERLELENIHYDKSLVEVPITELIRPFYSSRLLIESQLVSLINSIDQFGFLGGIFFNEANHHVIDGWHRAELLRALGHTTIPCYFLQCNLLQEKRLHLHLNQQVSTYDPKELGIHFGEFDLEQDFGICVEDLGFYQIDPQEKFNRPQTEIRGYTKLMASIPIATFDLIRKLKSQMPARTMSEAIVTLVKYYDETH